MSVTLSLKTGLSVSLRQVLCSQVLQASDSELEELVCSELERNPALERAGPPAQRVAGWQAGEGLAEKLPSRLTPLQQLERQLSLITTREERPVAIYLLHCLDRHGYLRREPAELAEGVGVPVEAIEQGIRRLQQLEPAGIGARDLRECLLLQCADLAVDGTDCAVATHILQDAWQDVVQQRWTRIARRLQLTDEAVQAVRLFFRQRLYPHPLLLLEEGGNGTVLWRADLIIERIPSDAGRKYAVRTPRGTATAVRISTSFQAARGAAQDALAPGERAWIEEHVAHARLLISAIRQRWQTLRRVGEFLVDYQRAFLDHGPLYHRPLTRATVAAALGLHPSTVGRAVREKVVQLPDGQLAPLHHFFDDSLAPKAAIRELMVPAEAPLSDGEIARRLAEQGIHLARRTVSKYRREMRLPPRYLEAGMAGG